MIRDKTQNKKLNLFLFLQLCEKIIEAFSSKQKMNWSSMKVPTDRKFKILQTGKKLKIRDSG